MTITYTLVNPQIKGSMKTQIKAENSLKAAKKLYGNLSEHFNNNVPAFYFTIQKGGSGNGKYYHFKVSEMRDGSEVDFTLEPIKIQNEKEQMERFENKLKGFKKQYKRCEQKGGAKSMETDSEDYDEKEMTIVSLLPTIYDWPIGYFWYDPYVFNLDFYYVPTFYPYITPFIEIVGI